MTRQPVARHTGFTCDRAELESLAQAALERAKRAGASGCDAEVSEAHGLTVTVRKGKPDTIEHNRDRSLGVSVYFGEKLTPEIPHTIARSIAIGETR